MIKKIPGPFAPPKFRKKNKNVLGWYNKDNAVYFLVKLKLTLSEASKPENHRSLILCHNLCKTIEKYN